MSPSGVTTTRCGFGVSTTLGAGGLTAASEGEGNVATSAILCSAFSGGSPGSAVIGAGSRAGATAVANCAAGVLVSPKRIQSCGGAAIPHTFPGFSNSTPTCWSSRGLCEVWTERTLARTAGGFGSTFKPTTCIVIHVPTP
jgi:hypothetical protein